MSWEVFEAPLADYTSNEADTLPTKPPRLDLLKKFIFLLKLLFQKMLQKSWDEIHQVKKLLPQSVTGTIPF